MFILLLILIIILSIAWIKYLNRDYYILALCKRIKTADGSPLESKVYVTKGKTIFGNNLDVLNMNAETLFKYVRDAQAAAQGRSFVWHFMKAPVYNVANAEDAEAILQSTALITKNVMYELVRPFLGEGLLISTDKKWHTRRKLLTPAFHFGVLQTFLDIFKEESQKLVDKLDLHTNEELALDHVIPHFTLNNVCETAMGIKLDDTAGSEAYRHAIHKFERIATQRVCNPLMYYELVFRLFGDYSTHHKCLKIVHDFTNRIIEKRRLEFRRKQNTQSDAAVDEFGKKKRYSMLDTLLEAELNNQIDIIGIQDEVNTFMFEGYDTTSTSIIFTLLILATHPDIQERCYEEVAHLPEISDLSIFDFNKLEYIECVIKESLRMFPSVSFMGRQVVTTTTVNGLILPEGTQINLQNFDIMRDPKHFLNPHTFNPERHLPENTIHRHPFAFIPFSAGQRNCIGQKFATLEIKVLLAAVLKNFQLLPVTEFEDIILEYGIVLRTQQKVKVKFIKRSKERT